MPITNVEFRTTIPTEAELATLDRISGSTGQLSPDDMRELARITAVVARQGNDVAMFLCRISSLGPLTTTRP